MKGFEELEAFLKEIDQKFQEVNRRYRREVRCKKGCAHCCYAPFDLSFVEALYMRRAFLLLPRRLRREITRRLDKYKKAWESSVPKPVNPFLLAKVKLRCPFLNEKDLCELYQARPATCRMYGIPILVEEETFVCPHSGFEPGKTYPTVLLNEVFKRLSEMSEKILPGSGNMRVSLIGVIEGGFPGAYIVEKA